MQTFIDPGDLDDLSIGAWADDALRGFGRPLRLGQGTLAARAGDAPASLIFVEHGRLALTWLDAAGRSVQVGAVGAGGVLGLVEAVSGGRFAFDVEAEQAIEGWGVPVGPAVKAITADPAATAAVWRHAMGELNASRRVIGCVLRHSAEARLADWLLRLDDPAPGRRLTATQEALGLALGLYRTTVSELISRFVAAGWVRGGRGWLEVSDRRALGRTACGCRNVSRLTDDHGAAPQGVGPTREGAL